MCVPYSSHIEYFTNRFYPYPSEPESYVPFCFSVDLTNMATMLTCPSHGQHSFHSYSDNSTHFNFQRFPQNQIASSHVPHVFLVNPFTIRYNYTRLTLKKFACQHRLRLLCIFNYCILYWPIRCRLESLANKFSNSCDTTIHFHIRL